MQGQRPRSGRLIFRPHADLEQVTSFCAVIRSNPPSGAILKGLSSSDVTEAEDGRVALACLHQQPLSQVGEWQDIVVNEERRCLFRSLI